MTIHFITSCSRETRSCDTPKTRVRRNSVARRSCVIQIFRVEFTLKQIPSAQSVYNYKCIKLILSHAKKIDLTFSESRDRVPESAVLSSLFRQRNIAGRRLIHSENVRNLSVHDIRITSSSERV